MAVAFFGDGAVNNAAFHEGLNMAGIWKLPVLFTPIINYPECAILGVGRILRQPVAVGDSVELRDIITLSLTFDHRALDGAPATRFLQTLVSLIESPGYQQELLSHRPHREQPERRSAPGE